MFQNASDLNLDLSSKFQPLILSLFFFRVLPSPLSLALPLCLPSITLIYV